MKIVMGNITVVKKRRPEMTLMLMLQMRRVNKRESDVIE